MSTNEIAPDSNGAAIEENAENLPIEKDRNMPNPPVRKRATSAPRKKAAVKRAAPQRASRVKVEELPVEQVKRPTFDFSAVKTYRNNRDVRLIAYSIAATLIAVLAISSITGWNLSFRSGSSSASNGGATTVSYPNNNQSGQVALTEAQLRAEVAKIDSPVYWVGAQKGAKYSLENQAGQRIFVRYLPDGKIPAAGEATKRIVGTYKLSKAFDSTKAAGTSIANGIGFVNTDGAAVYYNKTAPNNVYAAFPGVDNQIEIFDPTKGIAVQLATTSGALQVIK